MNALGESVGAKPAPGTGRCILIPTPDARTQVLIEASLKGFVAALPPLTPPVAAAVTREVRLLSAFVLLPAVARRRWCCSVQRCCGVDRRWSAHRTTPHT
jgi:hypothetical protein